MVGFDATPRVRGELWDKLRVLLKVQVELAELPFLLHQPARVLKINFDSLRTFRGIKPVSYNWSGKIKLEPCQYLLSVRSVERDQEVARVFDIDSLAFQENLAKLNFGSFLKFSQNSKPCPGSDAVIGIEPLVLNRI